jgi:hypothetical protein
MEYRIVHVRDIKGVEQQQEILNDMAADGRPGRSEDAE